MHFAGGTNAYYLTHGRAHTWIGDWLDEAAQFVIPTSGVREHEILSVISQGSRRKEIYRLAQRNQIPRQRADALLDEAIAAGAIHEETTKKQAKKWQIGRLIPPVIPELRAELWKVCPVTWRQQRAALTLAIEGEGELGERINQALCDAQLTERASLAPDVVIRIDSSLPDPTRLTEMRLAGQTYLSISTSPTCLAVGPLVIPGVTPCITCANHRRTSEDPHWPALAMQLQEVSYPLPEEAIVQAAVACVVMQMIAVAHSRLPITIGAMAVFSPRLSFPVLKRFGPHPKCGCGAGGPNPWGI